MALATKVYEQAAKDREANSETEDDSDSDSSKKSNDDVMDAEFEEK